VACKTRNFSFKIPMRKILIIKNRYFSTSQKKKEIRKNYFNKKFFPQIKSFFPYCFKGWKIILFILLLFILHSPQDSFVFIKLFVLEFSSCEF
jgi:hypothetical protein